MILLFGEKASKTNSARRSSNIKNHPVENSGILANRGNVMPSLLDANEYDMYMFSVQANIDYSQYSDDTVAANGTNGYSNIYAMAMNSIGDGSYSSFGDASFGGDFGGGFSGGDCGGGSFSGGGFSSVG